MSLIDIFNVGAVFDSKLESLPELELLPIQNWRRSRSYIKFETGVGGEVAKFLNVEKSHKHYVM